MSSKNLVLLIVAHQAYIRHIEDGQKHGLENDILFNSISNVYIPLLNTLHNFDLRSSISNIPFKISLVVSPTLCEMLSDEEIKEQYIAWLDKKIAFGEKEVIRCKDNEKLFKNAESILENAKRNKSDFCEIYNKDIIGAISNFSDKGKIELLATCGTFAYLPHYADLPEVINAQIESGLSSHRHFFGKLPNGFYLPYLGYFSGVEKILRSYGLNYSLIDSRGLLFSKDSIEDGIFAPVKCEKFNSFAFFAQDSDSISAIKNFSENPIYKDTSNDVGFSLDTSDLVDFISDGDARIPTGFRYFSKNNSEYDYKKAQKQVEADALSFVELRISKLNDAEKALKKDVSLVCSIPADILGGEWEEGSYFIESVLDDLFDRADELSVCSCSDVMKVIKETPQVSIYPCANTADGFAENLLNSSNAWLIRYARKMSERMIDIADRFPNDTGLKVRLLNLGAKELLLAQSSDWLKMINNDDSDDENLDFSEYAEKRFKESIKSFIIVYDSLGSNTVSTEWLTKLERQHTLFKWMNFRIFSKKK